LEKDEQEKDKSRRMRRIKVAGDIGWQTRGGKGREGGAGAEAREGNAR
jgi:hypothetical protein